MYRKSAKMLLGLIVFISISQALTAQQYEITRYDKGISLCKDKIEKLKSKITGQSFVRIDPSCLIGYHLPTVMMEDLEGNTWSNESLKGKKNILNFWFTTCPPCIKEIPVLNAIKNEVGEEDINYLALCRDDISDVNTFLQKNEYTFTIIPGASHIIENTFQMAWGYPVTLITDEDLKIIEAFSGELTEDQIRELIVSAISK